MRQERDRGAKRNRGGTTGRKGGGARAGERGKRVCREKKARDSNGRISWGYYNAAQARTAGDELVRRLEGGGSTGTSQHLLVPLPRTRRISRPLAPLLFPYPALFSQPTTPSTCPLVDESFRMWPLDKLFSMIVGLAVVHRGRERLHGRSSFIRRRRLIHVSKTVQAGGIGQSFHHKPAVPRRVAG